MLCVLRISAEAKCPSGYRIKAVCLGGKIKLAVRCPDHVAGQHTMLAKYKKSGISLIENNTQPNPKKIYQTYRVRIRLNIIIRVLLLNNSPRKWQYEVGIL